GSTDTKEHSDMSMKGTEHATLSAKLVDESAEAKNKMATIELNVSGVKLSDKGPHIHYQLDNGPYIVTPVKTLTFAGLASGSHTVVVTVVNAHHQPISDPQTLTVNIP